MSNTGKVVIITGAGGGIGSATAIHFAKLNARLALVDINKAAVEKTAEQCRIALKAKDENIILIPADLSKEDDVRNVIDATVEKFGRIDVLVNNAATTSKDNIFKEIFLENYEVIFNINLKAPMLLTHLAVPYLKTTKVNIVNVTSVGGIKPLLDHLIYNAAKAALRHFTKNVALELAPLGIRVNSIAPAGVKIDIVKLLGVADVEEFQRKRAAQLPLGRMIECEEVAELIGFLASGNTKSITGVEYVIDAEHLLGGGTPKYDNQS